MSNIIKRIIARRRWAHVRACHVYGRGYPRSTNWLNRRLNYDRLFREYLRIAKIMQRYHTHLD